MKKFLALVCLVCSLSGCFSLRSDYQPMAYYRLVQNSPAVSDVGRITGALYVRTFTANEEFENNHIVYARTAAPIRTEKQAETAPQASAVAQVDYYTYHRWISETPELVTDFVASRYMQSGVFPNGIVQAGSSLMPAYVLEGKILDMTAYNGEPSGVVLKLQCTLLSLQPMSKHTVLWQQVYEQRVLRSNNTAASIPEAYSDALAVIADQLLVDIARAVAKKQ